MQPAGKTADGKAPEPYITSHVCLPEVPGAYVPWEQRREGAYSGHILPNSEMPGLLLPLGSCTALSLVTPAQSRLKGYKW